LQVIKLLTKERRSSKDVQLQKSKDEGKTEIPTSVNKKRFKQEDRQRRKNLLMEYGHKLI
jgi:hypothetical protein